MIWEAIFRNETIWFTPLLHNILLFHPLHRLLVHSCSLQDSIARCDIRSVVKMQLHMLKQRLASRPLRCIIIITCHEKAVFCISMPILVTEKALAYNYTTSLPCMVNLVMICFRQEPGSCFGHHIGSIPCLNVAEGSWLLKNVSETEGKRMLLVTIAQPTQVLGMSPVGDQQHGRSSQKLKVTSYIHRSHNATPTSLEVSLHRRQCLNCPKRKCRIKKSSHTLRRVLSVLFNPGTSHLELDSLFGVI